LSLLINIVFLNLTLSGHIFNQSIKNFIDEHSCSLEYKFYIRKLLNKCWMLKSPSFKTLDTAVKLQNISYVY